MFRRRTAGLRDLRGTEPGFDGPVLPGRLRQQAQHGQVNQEPVRRRPGGQDGTVIETTQHGTSLRWHVWTAVARGAMMTKPILPGRADGNQATAAARRGGRR